VCPHAAIRIKVYDPQLLKDAPLTFKSMDYKGQEFEGMKISIQTAPEDCTGCGLCVHVCPAKSRRKSVLSAEHNAAGIREQEKKIHLFLDLSETIADGSRLPVSKDRKSCNPFSSIPALVPGVEKPPT
jgi:pyruvate-ferredoxin/flavodoxin oxidoreductase